MAVTGVLLGYQVIDVQVVLRDLVVGRGTATNMVTACVAQAVAGALGKAGTLLLEPIMDIRVRIQALFK